VAVGYNAGNAITSGDGNLFFGSTNVGANVNTGKYNIAAGTSAMRYGTSGDYNIGIGVSAVKGTSGTALTGDHNVGFGYSALRDITSGSYNVGIGYKAGQDMTGSDSNLLFIANNTIGNNGTLIKGDFSNKYVAVGKADVTFADAAFQIYPNGTNDVALYVKQIGSSSGDLILMENNTGTDQFVVSSSGAITTGSYTATAIDGAYIDIEGTEIKSTGESGGTKFLREDGDGTCSWQTISTSTEAFKTISVSGQDNVVADSSTDTLTLAAGSNVTITTTAASDTITIAAADTNTQLSQEQVEDYVGGMVTGNTETLITVTYQDGDGTLDFVVDNDLSNYSNSSSGFITASSTSTLTNKSGNISQWTNNSGYITATLTDEQVQDKVGAMFSGNTETLITATYQDADGTIDLVVDNDLSNYNNSSSGFITATLTQEQVEDYVGGMVTGNTETGITVTYQDGDGTLDFAVSDTTVAGDSGSTGITPGDTLTIAGGTNVTTAMSGDTLTITATDTNTMGSGFVLEDGDGTEVTITESKEVKFVEGTGIDIDWSDTDNGTDGDPYDLTFTVDLEGTELKSTGESGGSKFLREDGDGSCSWQTVSASVDIDALSALGGTGVHQTQDHFMFSDNGTEKKITFSNLQDAIFADVSGDATIAAGGALTIAANSVDGSMIALGSDAQGDIMYFSGTDWVRLAAGTNGHFLKTQGSSANPVWASVGGGTATAVTVADESSDTTCFPLFVTAATGDLAPKTGSNLAFNSDTGALTATSFVGALTGNADTATALATGRTIGMTGDVVWTSASFTGAGNVTGTSTIQADAIETAMIEDDAVTYAKIQNVTNARMLGNNAGSDGVVTEMTKANVLSFLNVADGADVTTFTLAGDGGSNQTITAGNTLTVAGGNGITTTGAATDTVSVAVDAAQTTITSILATDLKIGEDDQTKIDFEDADKINFYAGNEKQLILEDGALYPGSDNIIDLGKSDNEFKNAYFDGTVTSDAFAGPLTGNVTGNADTATALANGRTIAMTGDVSWTSASFDGSGNVTGTSTIGSDTVHHSMLNDDCISGFDEITSGLVAADEMLYSDGGTLKRVGADTLATKLLGLASAGAVAQASDHMIFLDGGATGDVIVESIDDFLTAIAGSNISVSSSQLTATNTMGSGFVLEDGDGTEVTITESKEVKFVEGTGIDIDWTDTDNGTDGDPYDLTFTVNLEGTELASTGESGGSKFLREDGDGSCSWQTVSATVDIDALSALGGTGLHQTQDHFMFSDNGTEKKITFSNLEDAIFANISGDATIAAGGAVTLAAAQTNVTSLLATDIKIGEDDQTKIDFEDADKINFYAGNEKQLILEDGALYPGSDNIIDLGKSDNEFKDAYFDGTVTADAFAGPLTGNVTGNVSGTAATVTGAAQSNITSLGTLTTLTVDSIIINGTTIGHTSDTDAITIAAEGDVTFSKAVKPAAPAAASGTSGIVVLDCDTTNHFTITTSGNITGWNFTNASVGQRIIVRVTNGASHTVGFSASGDGDVVYFPGGTEPTLTTSGGIDVYGFLCVAADTFDGFILGQDIKA